MEKKLESAKAVKQPTDLKKLSYEQLENACQQLSVQNQQLLQQRNQLVAALRQANLGNLYKRLDYLFNIIEKDNQYLSTEFKQQCASEIETLMATPENELVGDNPEAPVEEKKEE